MSQLRNKARAQTALEVLFLTGIILLGAALVVRPYLKNNSSSELILHVRGAAESACAYLNTGVVLKDEKYTSLNDVIVSANYSSIGCIVRGVGITQEDEGSVSIKVSVEYHKNLDRDQLKDAISDFIKRELKSRSGFTEKDGELYHWKRRVKIDLEVRKE
ncbi:hypothetical protein [Thermococcus gorgonarius]|uniref:Class III signal peptide-containing protein n=1 Tax=Thermococcus gorgonarius TaxID=71997 RepID=A0A2Z2M9N7_THEGO|nr:hypothetical protein [Thermococcus gorgonarius]ASJ01185.1 hypothetical protein A3K92_06660 [Thermococcus gorgonarius]